MCVATVASSHCGRNRTLASDLAGNGPLAGLKRPLGGLKCCDADRRPLCAGSPGLQYINGASCLVPLGSTVVPVLAVPFDSACSA